MTAPERIWEWPEKQQILRPGVKATFGQFVDHTSPDWCTYIRADLCFPDPLLAEALEALREALNYLDDGPGWSQHSLREKISAVLAKMEDR